MNIIRALKNSCKTGSHAGKGNKYYNEGNFSEALRHYELAVQYQEQCSDGQNPAILEYLAMTHAQLGNLREALRIAERSYNLYCELNSRKHFIADAKERIEYFISLLRAENNDEIKKWLTT